jgi:hypothetical protein
MKLLILGWDGATQRHVADLRLPYIGSLPYRGRLLPEDLFLGAYIDSANAWTTITTGVPFRDHRVLLFRYPPIRTDTLLARALMSIAGSRAMPELSRRLLLNRVLGPLCRERRIGAEERERWSGNFKGRVLPVVSTEVRFRRLWDETPGRSLIFEVPLTYPAIKVEGVLVSGIPAPRFGHARYPTVFPQQLEESIRRQFPGYSYDDGLTPVMRSDRPNLARYLKQLPDTQRKAADAFLSLASDGDFEFGFCMMRIIDDYLHAEEQASGVELAYRTADELSHELVRAIQPEHVLVLSDHGMKPVRRPNRGIRMDHDTTQGIWASDLHLRLRRHVDVAPAVTRVLGTEFRPARRAPELEDSGTTVSESETLEIEERLRHLGYL